jgi:hypothetical protein
MLRHERRQDVRFLTRCDAFERARLLADHVPVAHQQQGHDRALAMARQADHIGVGAARAHHLLRDAQIFEQADLVAASRRRFVAALGGCLVHLVAQPRDQLLVAAGEEQQQALDQRRYSSGFTPARRSRARHSA